MTFDEASSLAEDAAATLSAILEDWITAGQVVELLPVTSWGESDDSHSPSVKVHIQPELTPTTKLLLVHAVQPVADTGVPVTLMWSSSRAAVPPGATIH